MPRTRIVGNPGNPNLRWNPLTGQWEDVGTPSYNYLTDPLPGPGSGNGPILPAPVAQPGPNRKDTFIPDETPLPVLYGTEKQHGAQLVCEIAVAAGTLLCWWLSHGQLDTVTNLTLEDYPLAYFGMSQFSHYNIHLGSGTQPIDTLGIAVLPSRWTKAWPWIAYVIAVFPTPTANSPSIPDFKRFKFDTTGLLVRDPVQSMTNINDPILAPRFQSDLPVLHMADYMQSPIRTTEDGFVYTYGAGYTESMDWAGTITASRNACIFDIGGGTKRFTAGHALQGQDVTQNLELMRTSWQGMVPVFNSGTWQLPMDIAQSASGIVLSDQGASANIINAGPLEVAGVETVYTRVIVNYTDDSANGSNLPAIDDDPLLASGGVPFVPQSYDLPQIHTYDQAKRIARYLRKRSGLDRSAWIRVNATGLQILPGIVVTVTSAQLNWNAVLAIVTDLKSSSDQNMPSAWDVRVELYSAAVYDDTKASATTYAPPINPTPYDAPPEILYPSISLSASAATLYFSPPVIRSATLYGTTVWTPTNLHSYNGTKVNDGDTSTACFDFNVAGTSLLSGDFGTAIELAEWWLYTSTGSPISTPIIEYSDDNSSWTTPSYSVATTSLTSGITLTILTPFTAPGAHRYWRMRKASTSAEATTFTEVWPRAYTTTPYTFAKEFRVYNMATGTPKLYAAIPASAIPTSAKPFDLNPIATHVLNSFSTSGSDSVTILVTTVSTGNRESTGFNAGAGRTYAASGGFAPYVWQSTAALTLANGLNSNVTLPIGPGLIQATGPTGACSFGGFSAGGGGILARIYFGFAQQVTIVNEDASTTGSGRIKTGTGADVVLQGPCEVVLDYNTVDGRYMLAAFSGAATRPALACAGWDLN